MPVPSKSTLEVLGAPVLEWENMTTGVGSRMFGFSHEKKTLSEARESCNMQIGRTRLASLDVHFYPVRTKVRLEKLQRDYWVDSTRYSGSSML